MPRTKSLKSHLLPLIDDFAHRLAGFVEEISVSRARDAVLSAFGASAAVVRRGPGRPPGSGGGGKPRRNRKNRKKGPIQLCPVPGCKNRAAPVFGMVCMKHKGVPKAQIRKYREQRRAAKSK